MTVLHKFFAVTTRSLWLVTDELESGTRFPIVEKIATSPEDSVDAKPVGMRLKDGSKVGICASQIMLYDPQWRERNGVIGPLPPEDVNTFYWGGHTSPVVALFLEEEAARVCLAVSDRAKSDSRWQTETEAVLEAIGNAHPCFIISRFPGFGIAYPKKNRLP